MLKLPMWVRTAIPVKAISRMSSLTCFKFAIDLPERATEVVLPDNKDIVIFAATLTDVAATSVCPASELFRTANKCNRYQTESSTERVNILKQDMVMGYSSYVNEKEKPASW